MDKDVNNTQKSSISATAGYGLLAAKNFDPGDVIIRVNEPYIVTPENSVLTTHCYYCFKETKLSRCSGCGVAHYCGASCQKKSWNRDHRKECKIFKNIYDEGHGVLPTPVRALVKILLAHDTGPRPDPKWSGLESHQLEVMKKKEQKEKVVLQSMMALKCTKLPSEMTELTISILCRIIVNGFKLTLANDTSVGLCFDPLLALANHSCIPNAFISIDGRSVSVKALHPLKKGEEIRITYIDSTKPFEQRELELRNQYFFDCTCPRCQNDMNVYEVFLQNPVVAENDFSMNGSTEGLVAKANAMKLHKAKSRPVWKDITTLEETRTVDNLHQRWRALKAQHGNMDLASTLSSQIEHDLFLTYLQGEEFGAAFVIKLGIAFNREPFEFPEPWHPTRVTSMFTLYSLLKIISQDPSQNLRNLSVFPNSLCDRLHELPTMVALLLMVLEYTPRSHGSESRFAKEVKVELEEVERLVQAMREKDAMDLMKSGVGKGWSIARVHFDLLKEMAEPALTEQVIANVNLQGRGRRKNNGIIKK